MRNALCLILFAFLVAGLACQISFGDRGPCDVSAPRNAVLDAAGASRLVIDAGAGSLSVRGVEGADDVVADGTACARDEEALEEVLLVAERDGDVLRLETRFPRRSRGARLDLAVELPSSLPVEIDDGSGSVDVRDVASLELLDGSGEIDVQGVAGDVTLNDGSGEIEIEGVGGSVRITDGSGEIEVLGVGRDVIVEDDGSGGIEITGVAGDVVIESDGSGGIDVRDVDGDFELQRDGSGGVSTRDVRGRVSLP